EVGANRLVRSFPGHGGLARTAALSPDGKTLFTGGDDTDVRFWDVDSGKPAAKPKKGSDLCRRAAWSPDGKSVAAAHTPGIESKAPDALRLWAAKKGEVLWKAEPHDRLISCVAFSPDGKRVVTGGNDRTVRIFDAADGKELAVLKGHEGDVTAAAF